MEKLQLASDWLTDLSSVRLPRWDPPSLRAALFLLPTSASCCPGRCKALNLQQNRLEALRQLPKLPEVELLCLSDNAVSSLGGLGALGTAPLRSLSLSRNPVSFAPDYRAR